MRFDKIRSYAKINISLGVLKKLGWKKLEVFQPGEELEKLKD